MIIRKGTNTDNTMVIRKGTNTDNTMVIRSKEDRQYNDHKI